MEHGVFITPEYAALARKTDIMRERLVSKYGAFFDFFPGEYMNDPEFIAYDSAMNELVKMNEERIRKEKAHYCEKCNTELVPGENYFTMRERHICTKCEPFTANYAKNPRGAELVMKTEMYMNYPI